MTFDSELDALSDPDYLVRLRGIESLVPRDPSTNVPTEPGDPLLMSPLLDLAHDPTKNVRTAAAWTLGIIANSERGTEAKEKLRVALGDPRWRIRFMAARAYNYLRGQPFDPLLPLLDDDVESVRWAVASTLAWRKFPWYGQEPNPDPSLVAPLVRALGDRAPTVRAAAIRGLEPQDSDEAFTALVAGLHDVDYRVRIWPSFKLRDSRAVPELIDALSDDFLWVRANAARGLGAVRDRRAVLPLVAQLDTKNRHMRTEAARALGAIGDPSAIPALRALRDRSTLDWVRASATKAIDTITHRA